MAKKIIDEEPMLEENSDEILLEETSGEETLLEESGESEVLLEESSDEVLLEESADSETLLEEVDEKERKAAEEEAKRREEEAKIWAKRQEEVRQRERRQAAEERRRLETERKAEEDAIRKAKEAEGAKRRVEEEEKAQKEQRDKFDAITEKFRKSYEALNKEWLLKGGVFLKEATQKLECTLVSLENSLREEKRKCKFFQTPLYKKKGWGSIEECVLETRKKGELMISNLKKDESRIDDFSKQIIALLDSMDQEKNITLLESKKKQCNKLLREYKSIIKLTIDEDGLFGIGNFIYNLERWENGIPFEKSKSTIFRSILKNQEI